MYFKIDLSEEHFNINECLQENTRRNRIEASMRCIVFIKT